MRFRELHERSSGTRMPVATITAGLQATHRSKPVVMFVFGEHAREVITSEVGIWLARMLVDPDSSVYDWPELAAAFERAGIDAEGRSPGNSSSSSVGGSSVGGSNSSAAAGAGSNGTSPQAQTAAAAAAAAGGSTRDWPALARGWVQQLLQALEVMVVPIEALDSRRQVEAGELCVRKTAQNVDLNRNWPFAWRQESSDDEQYGGPSPLSEPQSKLMKHLFDHLTGRLLGYVNVHSGEWALYTPWDSKEAYGPGLPADLPDLVSKVGRLCDCKAGPAGAVSGYLAHGTSMDFLYVHKRVPYPLTVEVYGGGNAGKLSPGEANKALDAWPAVTMTGAPTVATSAFQRRRRRRRRGRQLQQAGGVEAGSGGGGLAAWLRGVLQGKQQRQRPVAAGEQQRRRLQQVPPSDGGGGGGAAAAAAGAASPAAGGTTSGQQQSAPAGVFSAGSDLEQLRQQAAVQQDEQVRQQHASAALSFAAMQQQQQQQPSLGGRGPQQLQKLQATDAILATAAAAQPHLRGCFDAFNPTSEADYRRVVADWLAASLVMLKHMADSPEGKRMAAHAAAAASLRGGAVAGGGGLAGGRGVGVHEVVPPSDGNATSSSSGGRRLFATRHHC